MIENIIESIKQAEQKAKERVSEFKIEANAIISKAEMESRLILKNGQESKVKMIKDAQLKGMTDAENIFNSQKKEHEKNLFALDSDSKKKIKNAVDMVLKELLK